MHIHSIYYNGFRNYRNKFTLSDGGSAAAVSVVLFIYIFILRSLYYIVFKSPEYDRAYNIHIFILYLSPSFSFNGYYTLL